jgi:N-acetylglucosaminyldiphosphoundecaprenol N-acetyl-beta-D-mannosaminyltransferase
MTAITLAPPASHAIPAARPSSPPHTKPDTVSLMGLDVAVISEQETIDYVLEGLADGRGGWICTANLDILRQWSRGPEARELVAGADLVVADGMPLVWAAELQGRPLPERVAGSTLVMSLTRAATDVGASIFLIGGNPGTAQTATERLSQLMPSARFVGTLCPPFGFEDDPVWMERIEAAVLEARPDIVYVGLGFPKQERLIVALRGRMPNIWWLPCGVSFSFVAGEIHRAPRLMQRVGLEWLHRMVQEPKRLFRRYLIDDVPFLLRLLWSAATLRVT